MCIDFEKSITGYLNNIMKIIYLGYRVICV